MSAADMNIVTAKRAENAALYAWLLANLGSEPTHVRDIVALAAVDCPNLYGADEKSLANALANLVNTKHETKGYRYPRIHRPRFGYYRLTLVAQFDDYFKTSKAGADIVELRPAPALEPEPEVVPEVVEVPVPAGVSTSHDPLKLEVLVRRPDGIVIALGDGGVVYEVRPLNGGAQ